MLETVAGILFLPGSPGPPGACVSRQNQENQSTLPPSTQLAARSTSPTEQEQEGLRVGELAFQQRKGNVKDFLELTLTMILHFVATTSTACCQTQQDLGGH